MSNKIFRSIITTAALVSVGKLCLLIGVLYGYFTQVIEKQLREGTRYCLQRQLKNRGENI